MSLFHGDKFTSHSGVDLSWKIDASALTSHDLTTLAHLIFTSRRAFKDVVSIPRGGDGLAKALQPYRSYEGGILIVDDVYTTGKSMREMRDEVQNNLQDGTEIEGVVIFSRTHDVPSWVHPIFVLGKSFQP
jgi:orotate phosphoribosyltransferase-like protein